MSDRRSSIPRISAARPPNRKRDTLAGRLLVLAGLSIVSLAALVVALDSPAPIGPGPHLRSGNMYPESGTAMPDQSVAAIAPESDDDGAAAQASEGESSPPLTVYETVLHLEKGDTLAGVLREIDFDTRDVANAMATLADHANLKRLPIGQDVNLRIQPAADTEARPILLALSVRPEARREITLERDETGQYRAEEKVYKIESRLGRAKGSVEGSLIASALAAGVPQKAMADMLRAFAWDVDFQHDMKAGDRFDLLIEQKWTEDGRRLDLARLVWGELSVGGGRKHYSIYRFTATGRDASFYTREGESVVKALLRTPLNLSRVSSRFGMRRHPLAGFMRMHTGIDYAAPSGTPVLAAGAGRIVQAGRNGGYGKWVKINHGNGLATGYAHMSRIAAGIKRSARVRQGQVIGFVGSTGVSTGPHLHFELHRGGKPVNPLTMARSAARERLRGTELERFKKHVIAVDEARRDAPMLK